MAYLSDLEAIIPTDEFTPLESTYIAGEVVYIGGAVYYTDDAEMEIKEEGFANLNDCYVWVKSEIPDKQSLVLNLAIDIPLKIGDFETELNFQSGVGYDYDGTHEWDKTIRHDITNTFHLVTNDALSRLYYSNDSDIIIKTKTANRHISELNSMGLELKDYKDVIALRDLLYDITPSMQSLGIDLDINNYIFETEPHGTDLTQGVTDKCVYKKWKDVLCTDAIWAICEPKEFKNKSYYGHPKDK